MITLNQNNGKKLYGKKYIYNLFCNNNITITNLIIKCNIKKNITFGFIGKKNKYILNPLYEDDETNININIELIKGNNYIYLYTPADTFEIKIENNNISLGDIFYKELSDSYIINKSNYYDILLNSDKYNFLGYINDPADDNFYEIELNKVKINKYDKYDNFINFIGNIDIYSNDIYTLALNMKYLIKINKLIIIGSKQFNNIINNNIINNTIYKMNPIIAYNNNNIKSYYIEVKFEKYNNNTRISFDVNNKIIMSVIDNILYINNVKIKKYDNNFIKIILDYKDDNTNIFIFDDKPSKKHWYKILSIPVKIDFYQKLYETSSYDTHINPKIVTFRKAYVFYCDSNKYIENLTFKYYNNEPLILLNNYTLILGGKLNYNNIKTKNIKLEILNRNKPISIDSIDNKGNNIISECFNNIQTTPTITVENNIQTTPVSTIQNYSNSNNNSNCNIINMNTDINKLIDKTLSKTFMFDYSGLTNLDIFKAFLLITLVIILYIKMFNKL